MAKDRKKLIHIHSSVFDKQPTATSLEVGEIAVNNAKDKEFLSLKNSDNKVVRFSSDEQVVSIMEKKEVMPYKGYVRGETGPSSTSGDTPTSDTYGSYGITDNDLLNNKSNIVIKLNQVAASNTAKHNKVNGAKDKYNKDVNPTNDSGITDGAGFFIDMSRYAMQGANPSFSSTTTTCGAQLQGNTTIKGGTCGSELDIITNTVSASNNTWKETITAKTSNITTNTETIVTNTTNVNGTNTLTNGGNYVVNTSGETHITSVGNTAIHSNGRLGLSSNGDLSAISTEGDMFITANRTICETAGSSATLFGVSRTNVGTDCEGGSVSNATNVYGSDVNVDAKNTLTISATTTLIEGDNVAIDATSSFTVDASTTVIGGDNITIDATSSLTIDAATTVIEGDTNIGGSLNVEGDIIFDSFNIDSSSSITINSESSFTIDATTTIINGDTSISGCVVIDGDLCVTGNITATGGVFSTSDERKKENINHINLDDKLKVRNIPLKSFNFIEDDSKRKVYGIIAQEVEAAGLNELVHTDEDGIKSVDYTSFLILRIAYLERMIGHMHSKIAQLEEKINK